MAQTFRGTLDEMKSLIENAGKIGDWTDDGAGKHTFRDNHGGVLNWWPSKGTVQFQGKGQAKAELEGLFTKANTTPTPNNEATSPKTGRQIFVVHGHDIEARDQLELAVRRLGLEPYILMNKGVASLTIIEALEGSIGKNHSADFGIVLMTPDDFGYAKNDGPENQEPRARQNVILEAGMLLASLTRERMAILVKGYVKMPSDLEGITRHQYNDHIKETIPKLCQTLQASGFEISTEQVASASQ